MSWLSTTTALTAPGSWRTASPPRTARSTSCTAQGKAGLGAAYIAGFKWGLDAGYDVLVEMDADGSHQPEQLPQLLEAVEQGADLAMGSRWVPGGSVVNWPLYRQAISRVGSTYARIMLGVKIKDVTGGFRAFRRSTLEKLNLDTVDSVGYGFQVDLAWRVAKLGLTIVERPITFVERELGASKMSGNIVVEAMINVTKWGLTARWNTLAGKLDRQEGLAGRSWTAPAGRSGRHYAKGRSPHRQ